MSHFGNTAMDIKSSGKYLVMTQRFMLLADRRFLQDATRELETLAEAVRIRVVYIRESVSFVEIDCKPEALLGKLREMKPTFIYGIVPIVDVVEGLGDDASVLVDHVAKLLDKELSFRIEVRRIGTSIGIHAKSIEVLLGQKLEGMGYRAELAKPELIVYLLLEKEKATIGLVHSSQLDDNVIDHFRLEKKTGSVLNRAEIKINEAFDVFGLNDQQIEFCLDIGAAPGGWTDFLVKRGCKVVAIDKGALDSKVSGKIRVVDRIADNFDLENSMKDIDVLHVRSNIKGIEELNIKNEIFDLVTIDINTEPLKGVEIATNASGVLKDGGSLIMTIKLQEARDARNIPRIVESLSGSYDNIRTKKLHHNRLEVTLYGRKL